MKQFGWRSVCIFCIAAGCSGQGGDAPAAESASTATTSPASVAPAPPIDVSVDQFAALRWIEGTWRGSGIEQPTFYERYTFVDDSTIRAESSPDSTFPDPEEAGAIELRGGRITTGDGETMQWAVSSIDARSVRFDPVRGARNTFVWTSESDSAWHARLSWTDRDGVPHETIYQMRRLP
jgi:hypothetical protein